MLRHLHLFENFYKYKRKLCRITSRTCSDFTKNDNKLKILFFGTDNFSMPSLKLIHGNSKHDGKISTLGVVTSFKSRLNPVRAFADTENIETFKWPIEESVAFKYDLGVVVSFGHYIPSHIISSFKLGMINVHASLLPRWRGAAPIIYALMSGDRETGVSIMKILPKHFDTGEILAQKKIAIHSHMKLPELHDALANTGAKLLVETIQDVRFYLKNAKLQDESLVTYAPKIVSPFEEIKCSDMTAEQIYNKHRSLYSFKSVTARWSSQKIKLIEMQFNHEQDVRNPTAKPGFVEFNKINKCLRVYCRDGRYVEVLKIGMEGKRTMDAVDFNNGFVKKCNTNDRYFQ